MTTVAGHPTPEQRLAALEMQLTGLSPVAEEIRKHLPGGAKQEPLVTRVDQTSLTFRAIAERIQLTLMHNAAQLEHPLGDVDTNLLRGEQRALRALLRDMTEAPAPLPTTRNLYPT